jgi:RNA polymerase sigma factor (sigma-70 family)
MGTPVTAAAVDLLRRAVGAPDDRSDAQLLDDFVHRRDPAAVEAIVRRHGPMVWGVCRRALAHHDAEDAFQATFLVLARRANDVRPPGLLGNWLYGVARRTALKAKTLAIKRHQREATVDTLPEPPTPEPGDRADLRLLLDRELERLPAKYRAPLVLCDLDGKTRQEAARRLGWPEGTVNSRLSIGRKKLAARLARRGLALSGGVLTVTLVERAAGQVPPAVFAQTVRLLTDPAIPQGAAGVLAQKVVKAMTLSNVKLGALILMAAGLVGGGALLVPAAGQPPVFRAGAGAPASRPTADEKADVVLKGHTGAVNAVAFSPNGQRVATAGADQTARIWDAATGKEVRAFNGHTLPVAGVAWEADGEHLITVAGKFAGAGGEVRRWNAETGELVQKLEGHTSPTLAVAVSPDGRAVAVAGGTPTTGEVGMWDLKAGKLLWRSQANTVWPFMTVAFSPDGKLLAVGGGKEVRAFDARNGVLSFQSAEHPDPVWATAFSPDGRQIASAGAGKEKAVRFWDAQTGQKLPPLDMGFKGAIKSVAYNRDGTLLAAGSADGTARVSDVGSGAGVMTVKHDKAVNAVAFSPDGSRLAVAVEDGTARIYAVTKTDPTPARRADPAKAEPAGKDPRQAATAFLELAVAGKAAEAREGYADPAHVSEKKVLEVQKIGLKRADVSIALAGATDALIITEPLDLPKEGKGHVLVYLRQKDGAWRVRDLDFEPSDQALRKQRDFLEKYTDAKPVRERK